MQLRFEQIIGLPKATLFAFHEDPEHLALLHRGWATFRMIHHDGSLVLGSRTWFETTIASIVPVVLGFEHTIYEPPHRFGERLIHGPFSQFTHIHEFIDVHGGTKVCDQIEVKLPWYYGGEIMMKIIVAPLLRQAFLNRGSALLKLAQTEIVADRLSQPFP
jgi:ligand-binding SRPBCC domain-containing protein